LNDGTLRELVNLRLVLKVVPVLPLVILREVDIIINCSTIKKWWQHFLVLELHKSFKLAFTNFLEILVKFLARRSVDWAAQRPDSRVYKTTVNNCL
jgi:hypothetical protein